MIYCSIIKSILIYSVMIYIFVYIVNKNCYYHLNIYIGNSFKNYYYLPKSIMCKSSMNINYKCSFLNKTTYPSQTCIFNGNRKFPEIPNCSFNIVITTEKLSQVKFMKDIGEGKNKYYQLAVDYRLFNNKYHISRPIYSYYNISDFMKESNRNFGNIESFNKRKNFVYIQRVSYLKRQHIIKELMKYFSIDSFGKDLHNCEWPKNISKNNKIELLKQYKFCIAIENSVIAWNISRKLEANLIDNDYVTEKLTDCLRAGCIPIYFGPQNIALFVPNKNSIINFRDYNSIYDLAFYLKTLLRNHTLLSNHLNWHNNISKKWLYRFSNEYTFDFCKICAAIPRVYKYV